MSQRSVLTARDVAHLAAAGIERTEAERQLALLAAPPPAVTLSRPCTLGDGIERLLPEERPDLLARADAARGAGRVGRFVPASGAASRMFRAVSVLRARWRDATLAELSENARAGDPLAREAIDLIAAFPHLALSRALAAITGASVGELTARLRDEPLEPLFALLLEPHGLDGARLPKGLLPFHAHGDRWTTAFEEQLAEGLGALADCAGVCRYHFTVAAESRDRFRQALEELRARLESGGLRLEIAFSVQETSTAALALGADGGPARRADGALLLRPSGHGALLGNLERSGFDLATIKNIDNVLPAERHGEVVLWKRLLVGRLLELEEEVRDLRAALERKPDARSVERVLAAVAARFGRRPPRAVERLESAQPTEPVDRLAAARALLDRPLRVCGVVPNTGEPGGGPYWVEGADGATPQIVESAQVDLARPEQAEVFRRATHFNPVDLAVSLRAPDGRPYALERFVDPDTAFVARKFEGGAEITVYERPGLWNGAMAGWNTVFVEVPGSTFAPVKTVLDLARAEHRVRD